MATPSLDGLTQPRTDISVLRAVLNQHWRVLVQDYLSLPLAGATTETRALHVRVLELVRALVKRDPRRVVRLLRRPVISGLVGAVRRHATGAAQAELDAFLRELDLLTLAELATHGDLTEEVVVPPPAAGWPVVRSLSARIAVQPPAGASLAFSAGQVSVRIGDDREELIPAGGREPAYTDITGGILFGATDNNPLLSVQGHPERAGNQVDLGGHPGGEWIESLQKAFAIIEKYQPLIMEEMRLSLELIVPVGYHDERHFSVSYEESVGAIYMTLHPGVMTMAEALIHEFQHNKLNAVFRWDPVLHNAHAPLFASPVRPDPRPLHGVLMAVHAFQPIAKLYELMTAADDPLSRQRDWEKRYRQIVEINREGAETVLTNGKPTAVGAGLLREMREIDEYFAARR